MSKIKIEFGIGTNLDGDGRPIKYDDRRAGILAIRARAVELFQGCTVLHVYGDWLDPETNVVASENSCVLSVLADNVLLAERVNAVVACIKSSLRQKAVAVTHYQVNFEIV